MNFVESDLVFYFCVLFFEVKLCVFCEWFFVFIYVWLVIILVCLIYLEDGEIGVCEREDYYGKCELGDVCLVGGFILFEDLIIF